jgi:hypothetical protein
MLMPEDDGTFTCKKDNFRTGNLFEYMDHFGVEYDWMVKLNPRYNFNLFTFLGELTNYILDKDWEEAYGLTQSVTLMMINASGEDFEEFVEEAEVITGAQDMFDQLERFLDDNRAD